MQDSKQYRMKVLLNSFHFNDNVNGWIFFKGISIVLLYPFKKTEKKTKNKCLGFASYWLQLDLGKDSDVFQVFASLRNLSHRPSHGLFGLDVEVLTS